MKRIIIIILMFLQVCCTQKNNKPTYIDFTHINELDNFGISSDSMTCYFPEKLFTDTISCYIDHLGKITDPRYFEKERYIQIYGGTLNELRDTIKIDTDSSDFKNITSYMLYKMKEPILSDRFLGKDIYRIIALRSLDNPVVIRIENSKGKVSIVSKKLNRPISYPFLKFGSFIMFEPPEINGVKHKIDKEQYEMAKRENDSLRNLLNNTNYYLTLNVAKNVMSSVWDSLEVLVDSAKFWKTKPELYLNYLQVDGSMWYIEGHFKSGYQIKRIPGPHFSKRNYTHNYDKDDYYAHIFKFLFEKAELEKLY